MFALKYSTAPECKPMSMGLKRKKHIGMAAAVIIALATTAWSCRKSDGVTLPLPTAYPRPNLPDTVLVEVRETPLAFFANRDAEVTSPHQGWLDIAYPSLGATVHATFTGTTPAGVENVKENRMERLMLNAGDTPVEFSEFVNPGGFKVLMASSEGSLTPLQFLATDDSVWVVSGAVYFSSSLAASSPDSIRPHIKAIRSDLVRALNSLDYK